MSSFNPDTFLDSVTKNASITQLPPIPRGEHPAYVKPGSMKFSFVGQNNKPVIELYWIVDDQESRDATGLPEPTVRQTLWLNQHKDGTIDLDGSPDVGSVREAVGLNKTGENFSPRMLEGKRAKVFVEHSAMRADGKTFANVVRVAAP